VRARSGIVTSATELVHQPRTCLQRSSCAVVNALPTAAWVQKKKKAKKNEKKPIKSST
jgi:hypothetical protein